jgi:hypothetical protein
VQRVSAKTYLVRFSMSSKPFNKPPHKFVAPRAVMFLIASRAICLPCEFISVKGKGTSISLSYETIAENWEQINKEFVLVHDSKVLEPIKVKMSLPSRSWFLSCFTTNFKVWWTCFNKIR